MSHYKSLHADPMQRFVNNIEVLPNGCWQWLRSLATLGYGKFNIRTTQFLAHRFSYWLYVGDIPNDKQLDHTCRNRGCVNPDHLEPVTIGENVLRGIGIAPTNKAKTSCPKGHIYDGYNKRGNRICKQCMLEADRRYLERKRLCLV